MNGEATRKATGPRTSQGKRRSRLNALKHGLLSKFVLLDEEPPNEFISLLNGLWNDFQPQGKLESLRVENLASLFWRKRRLILAENSEVSEKMEYTKLDSANARYMEVWDTSRAAIVSGGLLKHIDNPLIVREAIETFEMIRNIWTKDGPTEKFRLIKKLYGDDQDGEIPQGVRQILEGYAISCRRAKSNGEQSDDPNLKKLIDTLFDFEIKRLTELEEAVKFIDERRIQHKVSAAVIPGQQVSDRLMRYESHLTREIDRTLNRLERLKRVRKGQPLPPQVDVNIS